MANLPNHSASLEQASGPRVPLAGNCALGRSPSNTVVIDDVRVSRHHATIHVQDAGEFWLIDLGSINGTLLNERRMVQPQRLKDGDRITIAETQFVFRQAGEPGETSVGETPPTIPEVRQEARWLLLADIEGFTPLSQRLPPEELASLVGQWMRAGCEIVESHGGAVNKYLGDGYLACWPARRDSAAQIAAAVQAFRGQRAGADLKFRIVAHYGTVTIGGRAGAGEECLMGPDVNFIFRVEKVAAGVGVVFCFSTAARTLLAPYLVLEPIPGRHELKGFTERYEFFRL